MNELSILGSGSESHLARMAALKTHRQDLQRRLMHLNVTIAIVKSKGSERDWNEDFLAENGVYHNLCCQCRQTFLGHKHRRECKPCSGVPLAGCDETQSVFS